MTDRRTFLSQGAAAALATMGGTLGGCAVPDIKMPDLKLSLARPQPWVLLVDGAQPDTLAGWTPQGEGSWSFINGSLQGKNGKAGFLVSKGVYTDFELRAEFWADEDANSGIFLRCQNPAKISADSAYEVNIFDKRPDPSYGTGAIVDTAKVAQPGPKAANRWNNFEISARGDRLVVVLNGQQTVDVRDTKYRSGPIALQSAAGTVRFRSVEIRALAA
jgi:hypothetical protein